MKTNIKFNFGIFLFLLFVVTSCTEDTYSLGDLKAPTNVVITTDIVGKDATHPNGDGSGNVKFTITGDNILGSKIDYDNTNPVDWVNFPANNKVTGTYKTDPAGVNTFTITVVASGVGGTLTTVAKDVTVLTVKKTN